MSPLLAIGLFLVGVVVVVFATERFLEGLVGLSRATGLVPFVASAVLSGLEAENIAIGVAAGGRGSSEIALGTVYGATVFMVCGALGLGAIVAPLRFRLPGGVVALMALAPVVAGLPLIAGTTPRWTGAALLVVFALAIAYLAMASREHRFLEAGAEEREPAGSRPLWKVLGLIALGIVVIAAGGEMVARGGEGIIAAFGLSAGLVGMVLTPFAIEAEEIIRQVVPARRGRPDVSAGNLVGTLLYFLLFNLGIIVLAVPVKVPAVTRDLDWPFAIGTTLMASLLFARGRVERAAGALLAGLGVVYAVLHVVVR